MICECKNCVQPLKCDICGIEVDCLITAKVHQAVHSFSLNINKPAPKKECDACNSYNSGDAYIACKKHKTPPPNAVEEKIRDIVYATKEHVTDLLERQLDQLLELVRQERK